jgi:hypothetical protein
MRQDPLDRKMALVYAAQRRRAPPAPLIQFSCDGGGHVERRPSKNVLL